MPADMSADICIDMRIDICIDMCIDVCTENTWARVASSFEICAALLCFAVAM